MNPIYHQQRKERAIKVSKNWLARIKLDIRDKLDAEALKNFNTYVKDGGKLTLEELQKLNARWKADYIKWQLFEDQFIQELLMAQ